MKEFVSVSPEWLESNASGLREDVHCYWKGFFLARRLMWYRLKTLATMIAKHSKRGHVLDAGGGLGLMLPTLAKNFDQVSLLDLETSVAEKVRDQFAIKNCEITKANILTPPFKDNAFDAVIAAAFLEHFKNTDDPVDRIYQLMKPGALLFIDLPTENWVYRLGRLVGGIQKPADHYHGAAEIRSVLRGRFKELTARHIPPAPFALYFQGVFQK